MARRKSHFGTVRTLRSGRLQARYWGPDGQRHNAPTTFRTATDARAWLAGQHADIARGTWVPPHQAPAAVLTFREYAAAWLEGRDLKPRTRAHYQQLLDDHVLPKFADVELGHITPPAVESWRVSLRTGPTAKAHAYGLLKAILATAVSLDLIPSNPCRARGASSSKRVKKIRPATLEELAALVEAMPERYRAMTLLAAWCGLRFGELTELRRADVDHATKKLRVHRAVVRVDPDEVPDPLPKDLRLCECRPGCLVGRPKSDAGVRDVAIPPHLMASVEDHLARHVDPGPDSLLFPATRGGHMPPASLYRVFYTAREKAGRPDLRVHDLRHTGAVLAAATGATLAELMARLGHSTPAAAMRYQHAAADRDTAIAEALSRLAAPAEPEATGEPEPEAS